MNSPIISGIWRDRQGTLALLALVAVLTIPSMQSRDLWNPDEPRYAEVAREMLVTGEALVPHLNGEIYAEKPPLFFWLSALLQAAGLGMAAGRVVAAAAAFGSLWLTRELGRMLFGGRAGGLAAMVLATSLLFSWVARAGVLDVPLTFLTLLAIYGFIRYRREGGGWIILFYAGMGLATLTKGPVGVLVPLLAATAAWMAGGARRGWPRHALWGVPLTAAIIGVWLVPALVRGGPEYTHTILFAQNAGRMVDSWSHGQPWYYYLAGLPLNTFPWCLVWPLALVWLWRGKGGGDREAGRMVVLWFTLGLLIFTLISGKRERYLLPFYPALALAAGALLDSWQRRRDTARSVRWLGLAVLGQYAAFLLLAVGLLAAVLLGPAAIAGRWAHGPEAVRVVEDLLGAGAGLRLAMLAAILALTSIGGSMALRQGRRRAALGATAGLVLLLFLGADAWIIPTVNQIKSHRMAAQQLEQMAEGEGRVALFPDAYSGVFNIYTGRAHFEVLGDAEAINSFLASSRPGLVATTDEAYQRAREAVTADHEVRVLGQTGHRSFIVLVNPAALRNLAQAHD